MGARPDRLAICLPVMVPTSGHRGKDGCGSNGRCRDRGQDLMLVRGCVVLRDACVDLGFDIARLAHCPMRLSRPRSKGCCGKKEQ